MNGIFPIFARIWRPFQTIGWVLSFCRFNVFLLGAGGALLLLTSQGQEITYRLTDNWLHMVAFFAGVSLWAFHSWFWSRYLLNESAAAQPTHSNFIRWLVRHIPRIIGVSAFALATAALYFTWDKKNAEMTDLHSQCMGLSAILGILFYLFLTSRFGINPDSDQKRSGTTLNYLRKRLNLITLIYGGVLTITAFIAPAQLGFALGSGGIFFLALSSIAPIGNWLIHQTSKQGFPVILTLLLITLLFSFVNDNHELRSTNTAPKQHSLDQALAHWIEQAPLDDEDAHPFVIVATAGGGLRAAHWTATILAGLIDAEPSFRNALFAISGVSGGSVGATFTNAVLLENNHDCVQAKQQNQMRGDTCYEWQTRKALSRDFLGPAIAGFIYPDLIQRFLPFPINALPDRAEAIERGWEIGWYDTYTQPSSKGLQAPFTSLWDATYSKNDHWLPALLLNGTHEETGKRLVMTNLDITPDVFNDVIGLFNIIDTDIYASTAAHNSARFPYISPPGTLACKDKDFLDSKKTMLTIFGKPICNNGHVLDGGYFENFGAVTALELLRAAMNPPYRPIDSKKLRPIVILISSDPGLVIEDRNLALANGGIYFDEIDLDFPFTTIKGSLGVNETLGPIKGLLNPRSARGILAARELRRWIESCQADQRHCGGSAHTAEPAFFHFRMELKEGQQTPALGWLLSKESESAIRTMLSCIEHNRKQLVKLLELFNTPKEGITKAVGECL